MNCYFCKDFVIATQIVPLHSLRELGYMSHASGKNRIENYHIFILTHLKPMFHLYIFWKHERLGNHGFSMFHFHVNGKWTWNELISQLLWGNQKTNSSHPLNNYILNSGFIDSNATWFRIDTFHPELLSVYINNIHEQSKRSWRM